MDNDRTIGRANARQGASASSSGVAASASAASLAAAASGGQQPPAPPASPAGKSSRPSHTGAPKTTAKASAAPLEWPTSSDHYQLMNRVGQGAFASVWRARIVTVSNDDAAVEREEEVQECAIKIMDLEHVNINISDIRLEVQTMRLSSHPNVLVCHTSFVRDTDLWLVTQLMSKGSSLHCLQSARAKLLKDASPEFMCTSDDGVLEGGLTSHAAIIDPEVLVFETHITYILYETLLGLKYIHENGQIHRDIKAGNLLLDGNANVRIADFGVSSWLIDSGNRREHTTTFVGTPCWMAPEVMEQVDGYDYKADIWSLGITALELCKGFAPYAKYAPMKVLLLTIQEDPPSFETYNDGDGVNMWSKSFRSMIKLCLQKDPQKRPTCQELLANKHFKPLSKAEGRLKWREDTRKELCDVIEDVGNTASDGAHGRLPGAVPIQVVATMKSDRPAGTSWILPGGSQVHSSSVLDDAESDDFFDHFEKVTSGENFNRDESAVNSIAATRVEDTKPSEKKEYEDDMNDFFDQFEKETGGENFKR